MRISVPAAALALGGSLALGVLAVPTALAAPAAENCRTFGTANLYGEFIEGNDTHTPDAEGAVAIGGNADFTGGFSVGNELTADQVAKLPGGNALVVGGNLTGNVQVMKGNGVYAGTLNGKAEAHAGTVTKGPSPIDFAAEFAKLRSLSAELVRPGAGTMSLDGGRVTLTGTDATLNSFVLTKQMLTGAKEFFLKVPVGSVTVISSVEDAYDQDQAGTTGFFLWDEASKSYLNDDKLQSAAGGKIREKLLWNFPNATKVVKKSGNAWPGSVLAPNAAFDLGSGGPVNGSVIAKSLTGRGGAETHHYPFTGCLPTTPVVSTSPTPSGSTSPSPSGTPSGTPSGSTSGTPSPSGTPTPGGSGSPSASAPAGATPSPSAPGGTGGGGLAFTGASGLLPLTVGGVLVLGAGVGIAVAVRRRSARNA
ncbi:choice-of-anchor A family protein [Kitasatospora sp. NPDC002040]|uniref:choice-of-anchor A family protein n=1 Tax=Kitasatospora sp. NPDC002040 TaxID=3154661 RepID=UPI00331C7698